MEYLQHEHYAPWEVIEFGDFYKAPPDETTKDKGPAGKVSSSTKKKRRIVAITAEDMQKRKNDVKARTTLLLVLTDKHQLRFSKYDSAKELWEAILKTFGENEAIKKTKKNQLKQQYDTMSLDDVYNHLKVYEPEVQKRAGSNSQNMAFISSSNTSSRKSEVPTVQGASTASAQVFAISTDVAAASLSYDTTGKKITIQGSDVAGFDKSKVEYFNCHKMGYFARECRSPRSQDRGKRESYKKYPNVEEPAPKAMIAIDGMGWDWSYIAEEDEASKNRAFVADEKEETYLTFLSMSLSMEDMCHLVMEEERLLASLDESMLWHMRLGHLNFKTMNKLVRSNLVKDLPSKSFENDHSCVSCLKGKHHKASCKSKLVNSVSKPLYTLHMDLFGPTSASSLNHKWYCLVVTDDFSRKGIKREFSNTRTPQQNGVAERRNRTLIEVARTMLADAKLPVTFWAEAANTACYVQKRVLVTKPYNKTPYELFNERSSAIGFLRPFGCHVMILNTLDRLGKFDAKGDEGYFVGYSLSSKAFRVFNKRTKKIEENLHVDSLENKSIEKETGPDWLFDIDTLTNFMNYVQVVVAGTSSTNILGTKEDVHHALKEKESPLRFIALPNWFHEAQMATSNKVAKKDDAIPEKNSSLKEQQEVNGDKEVPKSSQMSNLTASSKVSSNDSFELASSSTVETEVPIISSPVPTDSLSVPLNRLEDFFRDTSNAVSLNEVEADLSNMETAIQVSPTPTLRIHKDHPKCQIIGPVDTPVQTRHKTKDKEEIDYEEVFVPVARIKAIRLFLAYASYMGFTVYQMDVKSAFLYGTIDEEVYVMQPSGFQDLEFPHRVYKVENAMYRLHQAPIAWYGTLSKYLLDNGFQRGTIDQTLFVRKHKGEFLLVQVYKDNKDSMDRENPWGTDGTVKDVELHFNCGSNWLKNTINNSCGNRRITIENDFPQTCSGGCSKHEGMDQREDLLVGYTVKDCDKSTDKKSDSTDEMSHVLGSLGAANILASGGLRSVFTTASLSVTTARIDISPVVATASESFPTTVIFTSASVATPTTRLARDLEAKFAQEDLIIREQAERDSKIARIHAERELKVMIAHHDRSNEMIAKYLSGYEQAAVGLSHDEKVELINGLLTYQRHLAQIKKYQAQQNKLATKTERRNFYMSILKSNAGWKAKYFKGMTLELIEEKFILVWEKMQDFVPINSKLESERLKRPRIQLDKERSKNVKTAKASGTKPSQEQQSEDPKELSKEELKKMTEIAREKCWKIIRVGNHTEVYQLFEDDIEDLDKLWSLVKETCSTTKVIDKKATKLWVKLKRIYEPDSRDLLWALQRLSVPTADAYIAKKLATVEDFAPLHEDKIYSESKTRVCYI
nr:hypothetical protein [Tanacetum cinerariifolium]